jgi:hypothetical protein
VSRADRFSIQYLHVVNVRNDLVTLCSGRTGVVRRAVQIMITDPINRLPGDHLTG